MGFGLARPERFELPACWFEASRSIHLSYGRAARDIIAAMERREVEVKLRVDSAAGARRLLRGAGFRIARGRKLERNTLYDTPDQRLRKGGRLLRIRETGGRALLTFKGRATVGRHKSRAELELPVAAPATLAAILTRLGLSARFRYEKFRTEYTDGGGLATLDETPIGVFVELEGSPAWIDRAARRLGYSPRQYITASYAALFLRHHPPGRGRPSDMLFS